MAVAERGYGLDKLIDDEDVFVRKAVLDVVKNKYLL
jgi:hypothetical protein